MSILMKKSAAAETDQPMLTSEEAIEQLRAMQERIPGFVQLPNNRQMRTLRRQARVTVEFARGAIGTVGASEVVQTAIGNTPEDFHHAEDEVARWTAVETELRAMVRGVEAANTVRRHRIGLAALQAFNVSRELVRREEHAGLLPYVEAMSRIPKYNRRRRKTPAAPPADPANPPKDPKKAG